MLGTQGPPGGTNMDGWTLAYGSQVMGRLDAEGHAYNGNENGWWKGCNLFLVQMTSTVHLRGKARMILRLILITQPTLQKCPPKQRGKCT
jgi:hypothetical protein